MKMKKMLAALLAVCMLLTMLPVAAFAAGAFTNALPGIILQLVFIRKNVFRIRVSISVSHITFMTILN